MDITGPENWSTVFLVVIWALTGISAIVVLMRIYTRTIIVPVFGWDDIAIIWSLLILFASSGVDTWAVSKGLGRHLQSLPKSEVPAALRALVISQTVAVQTFTWPKLSIAALLTRILNPSKPMICFLFGIAILNIVATLILSVMWVVQCSPVDGQWDSNIHSTCWAPAIVEDYSFFIGALSAFIDLFFALYAIAVISRLQMRIQKKITLSCILGLGIAACAIVIYKCTLLVGIGARSDPTWSASPLTLFTEVEANFLIFSASLPTLGPLMRRIFGRDGIFGYTKQSKPSQPTNDSTSSSHLRSFSKDKKSFSPSSSSQGSIPRIQGPTRSELGLSGFGMDVERDADVIFKKSELSVEMGPSPVGDTPQARDFTLPQFLQDDAPLRGDAPHYI